MQPFYKQHQTLLIWLGLFLLGIVTRLPLGGDTLYHWDSVNFAFGIEEFNVAKDQPHVPGYILYVYLTQAVDFLFHDAQMTITFISAICSGLAVAWLFLLGREMFNQRVGLIAALFLASSPLFWFYGLIALPHTLDTFMVILSAWFIYRLVQGQYQFVIPAAICLGLAGGFRPQTQVFLAPLILMGAWYIGLKRSIIAGVVLVVVNVLWFGPLLWLNGGPTEYFAIMGRFSDRFQTTTNVLKGAGMFGLIRNTTKLTLYTLYGWSLPLLLTALGGGYLLTQRQDWPKLLRDPRTWFTLLWIGPSFIYYLLIHMGQQGLVFVYLPMLLLLSALSLDYLPWPKVQYSHAVAGFIILLNSVIFLFLPTFPLGDSGPKLLTVDTLRLHDAYYQPRFEAIQQQFEPTHTAILATNWRFPQYYLRDYPYIEYGIVAKWELGEGRTTVDELGVLSGADLNLTPDAAGNYTLIIFDPEIEPFNGSPDHVQTATLPDGQPLPYLTFTEDEGVYIGPTTYKVVALP